MATKPPASRFEFKSCRIIFTVHIPRTAVVRRSRIAGQPAIAPVKQKLPFRCGNDTIASGGPETNGRTGARSCVGIAHPHRQPDALFALNGTLCVNRLAKLTSMGKIYGAKLGSDSHLMQLRRRLALVS